jgi:uncharacterized membrane protein
MSNDDVKNYEVMFAVYSTEDGAAGAVASLKEMDKEQTIDIVDAATLVKDADGNATVKQESLPSVKKGTGIGALIGGAIGLIFPPSIIASAAIGAGIGAGSAKLAKMALEDDDLKEAADSLEPGSSAFIAVVENKWAEQVSTAIAGYDKLAEHVMDADAAGVIGELGDDDTTVVYGAGTGPEGAGAFTAVTDGETVAGQAVAATVDDAGDVVVTRATGVADVSDSDSDSGSDDSDSDDSGSDSDSGSDT